MRQRAINLTRVAKGWTQLAAWITTSLTPSSSFTHPKALPGRKCPRAWRGYLGPSLTLGVAELLLPRRGKLPASVVRDIAPGEPIKSWNTEMCCHFQVNNKKQKLDFHCSKAFSETVCQRWKVKAEAGGRLAPASSGFFRAWAQVTRLTQVGWGQSPP